MNFPNKDSSEKPAGSLPRVEGLVLGVRDFKDNDAAADLLSSDNQLLSVYARGVQKEKSKNRRLLAPYTKVSINYEPKYSGSMLYLINGNAIASYYRCSDTLESQCVCEILAALIIRHQPCAHAFKALEQCWKSWQEKDGQRAMLYACYLVMQYLKETGVVMNVDDCSICQSRTNIVGLRAEAGGFVCAKHLENSHRWPKKRLVQVRRLVKVPFEKLESILEADWDLDFFIMLLEWYVYFNDARLKSLEFLKQIVKETRGPEDRF